MINSPESEKRGIPADNVQGARRAAPERINVPLIDLLIAKVEPPATPPSLKERNVGEFLE
ncbi:MAG: hypothetical protein M3Q44_07210 [bacterium]|nr:hypothetical protein [bacterium]